jgi:hypothetical protein
MLVHSVNGLKCCTMRIQAQMHVLRVHVMTGLSMRSSTADENCNGAPHHVNFQESCPSIGTFEG